MDDAEARAFVQTILEPGELLLWAEAAPTSAIFWNGIWGAVFCAGFFFLLSVTADGKPGPGVPRWVAGLAVLIAQIFCCIGFVVNVVEIRSAWSTVYAITDQRLLIAKREPWVDSLSYTEEDIRYYVISDDLLRLRRSSGRGGTLLVMHDLDNPEQTVALIKARVSPRLESYY